MKDGFNINYKIKCFPFFFSILDLLEDVVFQINNNLHIDFNLNNYPKLYNYIIDNSSKFDFYDFWIPVFNKYCENIDYIFVDEISMVHEIYYKFLLIIKQILLKVKFIICVDFKQLPPVCDRVEHCDYKNSHILYELSDHNRLTLSTCRRADEELFNICMNPEKVIK
jgi:hypothetical protein